MGGKLVEQRMTTMQYLTFCQTLTNVLSNKVLHYIPRKYHKDSHGDIDVCVSDKHSFDEIVALLEKSDICTVHNILSNTKQIVASFKGDNIRVQIDIVFLKNMRFAQWYDYGNMAGLIGRIIPYDLKLSHESLSIRKGKHTSETIIADDFYIALLYMGFDAKRFNDGFNTEKEMLEWLADSKYFNVEALGYNPRPTHKKKRDEKRDIDTQIDALKAYPSKPKMNINIALPIFKSKAIRDNKRLKRDEFEVKRFNKWAKACYLTRADIEFLSGFDKTWNIVRRGTNSALKDYLVEYANRHNQAETPFTALKCALEYASSMYLLSEYEKRIVHNLSQCEALTFIYTMRLVHLGGNMETGNRIIPLRIMREVMDLCLTSQSNKEPKLEQTKRILTVIHKENKV